MLELVDGTQPSIQIVKTPIRQLLEPSDLRLRFLKGKTVE